MTAIARIDSLAPTRSIVDLRKILADRFPQKTATPASRLATGIDPLDEIAGGLPKSAITEIITPQLSAGGASLIHFLLQSAYRDRYFVALIDGNDSFDPCSSHVSVLSQLFWVRCRTTFEAIKAADFLLRDGNFPLVIVDLVLNSPQELRKIPQTSWYRLQRLVENTSAACVVINRVSMVGSAQLKIVLENSWQLRDENSIFGPRFRIQRSATGRLGAHGDVCDALSS